MTYSDDFLKDILTRTRVIACVGISPKPERPSHYVSRFLIEKGMRVIPVNPVHAGKSILGEQVMPDLAAIPAEARVDMVDIFRRSEFVPDIVDEALAHLPDLKTIWMQIGIEHPEAAARAAAQGIDVVQNRCPKVEYPRLFAD